MTWFIWEMKFLFWEASHQKTSLVWNEESPNFLAVLICLLLFISLSTWLFHVEFIFAKKNHKITEHRLSSLSRSFRRLYRSFRRLYHVWRATFLQRFFSLTSLYYFIMIIYLHFFLKIVRYRSLHCMILELKHNIAIIDHIDYNCFNGNSINIWFDRNLSNK